MHGCPKDAKHVGVTATGLNVNFMQTEKIEQAAGILEGNNTNEVSETPHAYVLSPQNIRKNSALYWKQNSCRHKFSLKNQMKRTYSLTKFLPSYNQQDYSEKNRNKRPGRTSVQINAGQRYPPSGEVNKRGEVPQCGS